MNTYHDMTSYTTVCVNSLCEIMATTDHYELLHLFAVTNCMYLIFKPGAAKGRARLLS